MSIVVDTLKLADAFSKAGFEEKKAKVLAEKIGELGNEHLVTREYLDSKLEAESAKLKADLIKWLAPILLGQVAVFLAIVKLL